MQLILHHDTVRPKIGPVYHSEINCMIYNQKLFDQECSIHPKDSKNFKNPEIIESGSKIRIRNPENFFCQFFFLIHLQAFFVKQTYLKTDSFYKLPYRPYCLIGPKNGRGRSCFFLICSVEGCTPITMPKLARETALIDLAAQWYVSMHSIF